MTFLLIAQLENLKNAQERRMEVLEVLSETLLDVPFVLPFILCHVAPWRLPRLYARLLTVSSPFAEKCTK